MLGPDVAVDLAVDASGNVCVTGFSPSADNTYDSYDIVTIKYIPAAVVLPDAFTVQRGTLLGGSLTDLLESDDLRLIAQARPSIPKTDPNVRVTVEGTAPPGAMSKFVFRAESSTSGLPLWNVGYTIELYNFLTQSWEVFMRPASSTDAVEDVEITTDPEHFIESGTRKMRARLSWTGPSVLTANWGAKIDQAVWYLIP